jgi:hypothetical protein
MDLHRIAATLPPEAFGHANDTRLDGQTGEGLGLVHDGDELVFGDARFLMKRTPTLRQRLTTGRFRTPECSCCR